MDAFQEAGMEDGALVRVGGALEDLAVQKDVLRVQIDGVAPRQPLEVPVELFAEDRRPVDSFVDPSLQETVEDLLLDASVLV